MMPMPAFEGMEPKASRLKINGLSADEMDAMSVGTNVAFVIDARVYEVDHVEDPKVGLIRVHKARILRAAPVSGEVAGELIDEAEGRVKLPFDPLGALDDE